MLATRVAGATPISDLGLVWSAPPECPDAAAVRARIEQRAGTTIEALTVGAIEISVRHTGDEMIAAVTVDGDLRELRSASCDELADAVAMIVARVARVRVARREDPVEAAVVTAPPVSIDVAPSSPWSAGARVATTSAVGVLPGVAVGGELGVFVRRGSIAGELGYARWRAGSAHDLMYGDDVAIGLGAGVARLGWRFSSVPIGAWVVGELGSMTGTGAIWDDGRAASARWCAAGVGTGAHWMLGRRVELRATAEALDAVVRPRFELGDQLTVYEPARISTRVSVAVEVGWP